MGVEQRLAELAVGVGANVQPGQLVRVTGETGHLATARLVADAAYRRGARFVELDLFDPLLQRARLLHAADDSLGYVPPWRRAQVRALGEERGANIRLTGPTEPHAFEAVDPARLGRASLPHIPDWHAVELLVNWTVVPAPTPAWAAQLRPDLEPRAALAALEADLAFVCRLDEADPAAAWRSRLDALRARARALDALGLDVVRFDGPGTALGIGLLECARWERPLMTSAAGIEHMPNVPTEEVFTVPDPLRASGHVRLTRPALVAGRPIEDVTLTFAGGRVVQVEGGPGVDALRELTARDEGACRLGELALVDADSRVGQLGRTFGATLLDENATSHFALGYGFPELLPEGDRARVNTSAVHLDVMIGGDEVTVTGIDRSGASHPLIADGRWALGAG